MSPEDLSIADVITKLRRALAAERLRREKLVLRFDIANVLATGDQEGFSEGWPHHRDFAGVPCWPDIKARWHAWRN